MTQKKETKHDTEKFERCTITTKQEKRKLNTTYVRKSENNSIEKNSEGR